jgi:hypothetical protein
MCAGNLGPMGQKPGLRKTARLAHRSDAFLQQFAGPGKTFGTGAALGHVFSFKRCLVL